MYPRPISVNRGEGNDREHVGRNPLATAEHVDRNPLTLHPSQSPPPPPNRHKEHEATHGLEGGAFHGGGPVIMLKLGTAGGGLKRIGAAVLEADAPPASRTEGGEVTALICGAAKGAGLPPEYVPVHGRGMQSGLHIRQSRIRDMRAKFPL